MVFCIHNHDYVVNDLRENWEGVISLYRNSGLSRKMSKAHRRVAHEDTPSEVIYQSIDLIKYYNVSLRRILIWPRSKAPGGEKDNFFYYEIFCHFYDFSILILTSCVEWWTFQIDSMYSYWDTRYYFSVIIYFNLKMFYKCYI